MKKIILLPAIFLWVFCSTGGVQSQALFVWGNVKWVTGYPATGFEVRLISLGGALVSTTYTNQSGSYAFFGMGGQPSAHLIAVYYKNNLISQTRIPDIPPGYQVPDIFLNKMLFIRAEASPPTVRWGSSSLIMVTVRDELNAVISGARVTISAGGGKFLAQGEQYDPNAQLQGPFSISGLTDYNGRFTAFWVCNPCAAGYGIYVESSKENFYPGAADLTISIGQ